MKTLSKNFFRRRGAKLFMSTSTSIIPPNRLKSRLAKGGTAIGTFMVELRQSSVMQVLSNAGFDSVVIDSEHGPYTLETIADLTRAARAYGLTPLVRVPDLVYHLIAQPLDAGAQGVIIPRIVNVAQVQEAIQMAKFSPIGRRGSALSRGFCNFKSGDVAQASIDSNNETMVIIQIETVGALENLDQILEVPGVDAVLIGPNDLSIALDVPGQYTHPKLQEAISHVIASCDRHGVTPALHSLTLDFASYWQKRGIRFLTFSSEFSFLQLQATNISNQLRSSFGTTM